MRRHGLGQSASMEYYSQDNMDDEDLFVQQNTEQRPSVSQSLYRHSDMEDEADNMYRHGLGQSAGIEYYFQDNMDDEDLFVQQNAEPRWSTSQSLYRHSDMEDEADNMHRHGLGHSAGTEYYSQETMENQDLFVQQNAEPRWSVSQSLYRHSDMEDEVAPNEDSQGFRGLMIDPQLEGAGMQEDVIHENPGTLNALDIERLRIGTQNDSYISPYTSSGAQAHNLNEHSRTFGEHEPHHPTANPPGPATSTHRKRRPHHLQHSNQSPRPFICPLCNKGFSRRETVFDPHFVTCVKNNGGNQHRLDWDDHPSCQKPRRGMQGLFKSGRVPPGYDKAMEEIYGALAHRTPAQGFQNAGETNVDYHNHKAGEGNEAGLMNFPMVHVNTFSIPSRYTQEDAAGDIYEHPKNDDHSLKSQKAHNLVENRPSMSRGTIQFGNFSDEAAFGPFPGVFTPSQAHHLDQVATAGPMDPSFTTVRAVQPTEPQPYDMYEYHAGQAAEERQFHSGTFHASQLSRQGIASPVKTLNETQHFNLQSAGRVCSESLSSSSMPDIRETTIPDASAERQFRRENMTTRAGPQSSIQLDSDIINRSIRRLIGVPGAHQARPNSRSRSEESVEALASSDEHGDCQGTNAAESEKQKPVTHDERDAMRAYLEGNWDYDRPAPTRANIARLPKERKLTAVEEANLSAYLCGPRSHEEPFPENVFNEPNFPKTYPKFDHVAMTQIANVAFLAMRRRAAEDYETAIKIYEKGRSMLPPGSVPSILPPEPFAHSAERASDSARMATEALQYMIRQSKTISDSKHIVCLVKECLEWLGDETGGAEVDNFIKEEIKYFEYSKIDEPQD